MANVLHRLTREFRHSVDPAGFDPADWIINPDLTTAMGFAPKYWVISGDSVSLMDQAARDAVDAAEASAAIAALRTVAKAEIDTQRIIKSLALTIMDEINILRAEHGLSARTATQLVNAIKSKVDTL